MNKRHATCLKSQKSNGKQFLPFTLIIEAISPKQCFSYCSLGLTQVKERLTSRLTQFDRNNIRYYWLSL